MERPQPKRPPLAAAAEPPRPATLIPAHVVDHASQRLFALLVFAAIQCWKVYDILLVKADAPAAAALLTALNNFTFVLKYALVDGVFLWLLPVLRIPLLDFLPLATLVLTAAINLANFALASDSALPLLSSTLVPLWNLFHRHKELSILGDAVPAAAPVDMNAHFRGSYTIQYVPESSALLNPFGFGNMCLEAPDLDSHTFPRALRLPLELNTTSEVGAILLQRLTPENTVEYLNYSRSDIRKLARKDHSAYAHLPGYVANDARVFYLDAEIRHPGRYRIHRVLDVDGMVIRAYKSDFSVGYCPSAKLVYPGPAAAYAGYKCFSKSAADLPWSVPMVAASGMLPLTVHFATYQNGQKITTFHKTLDELRPETPSAAARLQSHQLTRNAIEQELLRAPHIFNDAALGSLEFQLLAVADAHGNQRLYNDRSKDQDVHFAISLKQAPALALRDKHPARKLVWNSRKTLHIETTGTASFPLTVSLVHADGNSPPRTKTLDFTFASQDELARGLQISEPGSYVLQSASDKYCPCDADSTPVRIVRPPLPSVKITDVPIFDKCVGTIGYEFDLKFLGSAPFEVLYEVFKNSSGIIKPVLSDRGSKQHRLKSLKSDYSFQFKPKTEGNYILKFKSIKDLHYSHDPVLVSEEENTFSTYIKKRSQVMFFKDPLTKSKTIRLCKGQLTQVPVYFDGHFPFSFSHDIVDLQTGNILKTVKHQKQYDNSMLLEVPSFLNGGEFGVRLHDVTDSLGCSAEFPHPQEITIKARKDVPLVEIADSSSSFAAEGDAIRIPLRVQSSLGLSPDDEIVYLWSSLSDQRLSKNSTLHGRSGLVVREEGVYKLESFTNAGCLGQVMNSGKTFTLRHYAKPNLTIIPEPEQLLGEGSGIFSFRPLCQDDTQSVKIRLEGRKPFTVNYEIQSPGGRLKASLVEIDNNEVLIPLPSLNEGTYNIIFSGVSDAIYTKEKLMRLSHKQTRSAVTYDVKAHPVLRVKQPFFQLCETMVNDEFDLQIPVALEGEAPFKIQGTILNRNEGQAKPFIVEGIRESTISIADLNLPQSYKGFSVGEHEIKFEAISDASHCESLKLTELNKVVISITKVPSITKQKQKEYYCVGDRVSYEMSGVSPFVVYYKFNDQNRKADLKSQFTRLATKAGDLAIVAIQDSSASQCFVNYTKLEEQFEELKIKVHDLPSVEISHGDSIIKNLHEGDKSEITFKFIGTPPFLVTYVRTLASEDEQHKRKKGSRAHKGPRKVVETKTISDIWDYEYSEVVSLQGTYDAIEVHDAFCGASRDVREIL
ncbi:hypothetical protein METBIDRAFT_37256 [Metschnikowia bicuspidata var. bicuspidata NRRL YB-4993]|uniref:Nucleoporin Pom152 n=1 Tax=Metschnikowia bicuspidata var. bicuspidata NRRL YB-4993 TaxID=869754 RepID=A0A1A0HJT3_9ASCO|nr:hypothetical protein METBIDRAFT_37256 [Metschnikowia bicuspidata var. bicuspidata NRRL YB-4993]OBA24152.1 hypothetical protein METBIDRAFT_37256 [Metschnikowia bicuspidata var. bicuspidata NRRL YB-4993]